MERKTILLVEDNPDDEALMIRALKKNNIANDIIIAHDGVEALDFLFGRENFADGDGQDLVQLILLDLKLPKLDGLEVLRRIRADERTKFIPVVVLTTSSEQRDLVESYHFGANSYVQKPVDFNEFMDATRQLGTYWLVFNRVVPPATLRR
ncbi:MAG: response regulator [Acidobacteria bacterium]|nr:response regulator [Acidobacteriota bacterium]